jgi:murein L,D-transpeptidase YcbB/YkuD
MSKNRRLVVSCALCIVIFAACKSRHKKPAESIASTPQELREKTDKFLRGYLDDALAGNGRLEDSTVLAESRLIELLYQGSAFVPLWSENESWKAPGDSLFRFISQSGYWGLFPEDYHFKEIDSIRTLFYNDSNAKADRKDASLWAKSDLMLTDAFVLLLRHVKLGRLPQDSVSLRKDSVLTDAFFIQQLKMLQQGGSMVTILQALEPRQRGYKLLKAGIKKFLDSADYRVFTRVPAPGKDPIGFKRALQRRLYEGNFIAFDSVMADSLQLATAIKHYQKKVNIQADGVAGEGTIRMLNTTDREKFIRISISLDRYKLLPEEMPYQYVWVNIPGYNLQLIEDDSVRLFSKVICGKPKTRTPVLTSGISELITYPVWVPPPSIITKEILPAVKKDPGYLARKGFSLVDSKGQDVDPFSVDWSKYKKSIPYRVVQGSGDANALGILKFNFPNKYSVYLHDTNQRYLFAQTTRSLSHGCVRVQEWQKLATYIIRNDRYKEDDTKIPVIDSMNVWLDRKEKHSIAVRNNFPVFIRYFTCEGRDGNIVFYDDIYGEDKMLREKYYMGK